MKLQRYLDRIGFDRKPRADVDTLRALQCAHACSVPFENLDVQLGRPVGRQEHQRQGHGLGRVQLGAWMAVREAQGLFQSQGLGESLVLGQGRCDPGQDGCEGDGAKAL